MAKPYDPKINPNKTLEETIENFIAWIRTSNRGTASVLRNISDKLLDISKTEENLKTLEISQGESLQQIKELLTAVSSLSSKDSDQNESTEHEIQNSLNVITSQLKQLADSKKTNQEEMQSEITLSMNRLEGVILDIKSDIITINSQLHIQSEKVERTAIGDRNIQEELTKIRQQIV